MSLRHCATAVRGCANNVRGGDASLMAWIRKESAEAKVAREVHLRDSGSTTRNCWSTGERQVRETEGARGSSRLARAQVGAPRRISWSVRTVDGSVLVVSRVPSRGLWCSVREQVVVVGRRAGVQDCSRRERLRGKSAESRAERCPGQKGTWLGRVRADPGITANNNSRPSPPAHLPSPTSPSPSWRPSPSKPSPPSTSTAAASAGPVFVGCVQVTWHLQFHLHFRCRHTPLLELFFQIRPPLQ